MTPTPQDDRACVLLVEDDDDIRETYELVLADEGYRTIAARNGDEALERLRADPGCVALVLLDLMMPRAGGLGFLKRKAVDPAIAHVPVVIASAIPTHLPIPDTPDIRAVLTKPVALDVLLAAVGEAVRAAAVATPKARPLQAPPAA